MNKFATFFSLASSAYKHGKLICSDWAKMDNLHAFSCQDKEDLK